MLSKFIIASIRLKIGQRVAYEYSFCGFRGFCGSMKTGKIRKKKENFVKLLDFLKGFMKSINSLANVIKIYYITKQGGLVILYVL